jgi:hypothetical protein
MTFDWPRLGPVLIAVTARQLIGLAWLSPPLFARQYAALTGITMEEFRRRVFWVFLVDTVGAVFTALTLQQIIRVMGAADVLGGIGVGLTVWFAFNVVTRVSLTLYARRPMQLYAITTAFLGVTMGMMGGILGYFV